MFPYSNYLIVQAKIGKLFMKPPVGALRYVTMQSIEGQQSLGNTLLE